MTNIYKLLKDGEIVYVGKADDIHDRLKAHKRKFNDDSLEVELIEKCKNDNWKDRERYWIKWHRELGHKLYNKHSGGNGGEVRLKYNPKAIIDYICEEQNATIKLPNQTRAMFKDMYKRMDHYDAVGTIKNILRYYIIRERIGKSELAKLALTHKLFTERLEKYGATISI